MWGQEVMKFLLVLILSIQQYSCTPMGSTPSESTTIEAEVAPVVRKEEGKTVAAISPESTKPQKLEASETSELGQSNAVFLPGALAAESEVSIEQGVDIVDSEAKEELGLQENYVPQSKPVNISSTEAINGSVPLTISLELSDDLGLSAGLGKVFIAFYILETENGPKLGIVPYEDIKVAGLIASFDFTTEGTYTGASFQLAAFEFSGASTKEVASDRQILPKEEPSEEEDLDEEPNDQDDQDISDSSSDDSKLCPETIDPAKLDISLELCGVKGSLDLTNLKPEYIVSGQTIAGVEGSLVTSSYNDCSSDGQNGCITNTSFPAVNTASLAAKLLSGQTLAGVWGSATAQKADCTSDGATDCGTTASFKAAQSTGLAAKVVSGNTVAGVAGTASAETRSNCSSDGQTGCIATATYTAAPTAGLAEKVLTGNTVAGVNGTGIELHAS